MKLFKVNIEQVQEGYNKTNYTLYLNEYSVKAMFEGEEFVSSINNPLEPEQPTIIRKCVLDGLNIEN